MSDAHALFDAGQLEDAAAACRARLAEDAADTGALRLLGVILLRQGAPAEAVPLLSAAAEAGTDAAILRDLAEALRAAGLTDEAAQCLQRAISARPDDPLNYLEFSCLLVEQSDGAAAAAGLRDAIALSPPTAEAWFGLGSTLSRHGKAAAAEACYRAAVAVRPGCVEALNNLGNLFLARHDAAEAAAMYRAAIAYQPDAPGLWLGLGNALLACGQTAAAEDSYRTAVSLHPDFVAGLNGLGNALMARRRPVEALAAYRAASAQAPDDPGPRVGIGNASLLFGEAAAAEQEFRAALAMQPGFVEAARCIGTALVAQHRMDAACEAFRSALGLDPANLETRNEYGMALLLHGSLLNGWRAHEVRREMPAKRRDYERRPHLPRWQDGMALEGLRVLVMMEQGFGDQIQFLRYVPMLAARGVKVTVEEPRPLQPVLPALARAATVIAPEDPTPDCDIVCPLMSLPLYFATTPDSVPAPIPYAEAPPDRVERWRARLGPRRGRRIGLACSGRPTYGGDHHRSIPLAALAALRDVADCEFLLLQPDVRESDRAALAAWPGLRWPGSELRDFGDTAAMLREQDLLIAVDTAVAHLAGAMGRPVWLLLPYVPDWRWLLHRRDTPWYPTMTLYRQPRHGDWGAVIEAVRRELMQCGKVG